MPDRTIRLGAACLGLLAVQLPALADEADLAAARAAFAATYPVMCEQGLEGFFADEGPETYSATVTADYEGAEAETVTLYGFACSSGAYNLSTVWFVRNRWEEIEPVAFARPTARYTYADGEDAVLASHEVTGMVADLLLVNATYDPDTRTMTSFSKWRGLGDASESGTWRLGPDGFTLVRYTADPTFDGEMDDEVVLYDAGG